MGSVQRSRFGRIDGCRDEKLYAAKINFILLSLQIVSINGQSNRQPHKPKIKASQIISTLKSGDKKKSCVDTNSSAGQSSMTLRYANKCNKFSAAVQERGQLVTIAAAHTG